MKNKKLIYRILGVLLIAIGIYFSVYLIFSSGRIIFCKDNSECPIKMKCENYVCVDVGCVEEGHRIPITAISPEGFKQRKHMATECCPGLVAIPPPEYFDEKCNFKPKIGVTGGEICSNCGNNICESWENKCNCPKDCK